MFYGFPIPTKVHSYVWLVYVQHVHMLFRRITGAPRPENCV